MKSPIFLTAICAIFVLGVQSINCYVYNQRYLKSAPANSAGSGTRRVNSDFGRDLTQEGLNKQLVIKFYTQVFGDRNLEGVEHFLGDTYIQHNPDLPDGKEAFINWVKSLFPPGTQPFTRFTIANIVAEGDLVWIHVLNNLAAIPSPTFDQAIVDIYRVQNGFLVEHFDVIQPVPVWSSNPHPMLDVLEGQYPAKCAFGRVPPQIN